MSSDIFSSGRPFAPEGLGLASLADSSLERRFYSWVGQSGNRYVCTVFHRGEEDAVGSFNDAAVIGVANSDGRRRPVCVLTPSDFQAIGMARVKAASALGVNEWHVHFAPQQRQLAADLACQ